ncbi:hypothetical protein AB0G85_37370 [Streptomyces sioyaensis]|uniref:hypothetical protein n=1 Tax=Streptomyces sioyaensis TaxID=67364 RepID=UPI0033D9FBDE
MTRQARSYLQLPYWIHGFRRLRIRWEIRDDIHEAFLIVCGYFRARHVRYTIEQETH